jgi:hypothetical protein
MGRFYHNMDIIDPRTLFVSDVTFDLLLKVNKNEWRYKSRFKYLGKTKRICATFGGF